MDIKLVSTDMDGTLLDSKKRLPADFKTWVRNHQNIKTVIASGRQYYTLKKDFEDIADDLIFVAENGALVFEKGEIIYKNVMKKQDVLNCLKIISDIKSATPILCGINGAYLVKADNETNKNAVMYYYRHEYVEDIEKIAREESIVKIAVFFSNCSAEESFGCFDGIGMGLKAVLSGDRWIDIANADVNKGNAVKSIQNQYGISKSQSMAFGDYLNDTELLMVCEESYCMANGHPELKRIAKHIADTNDNQGVMQILNTI